MSMHLLPAVDIAAGRVARVPTGDPNGPVDVAMRWVGEGAQWLHLVDLDRAYRRGSNTDVLRQVIDAVPVPIQLSGGLDDREGIASAAASGAQRFNLASSALLDVELITWAVGEFGPAVVVGLDLQGARVVARGSGVDVGDLDGVLTQLAETGATQFLVADASRDGTQRGADIDLFETAICQIVSVIPDATVVVSGGVASASDLTALAALDSEGLWGVVLGAALHHGGLTFAQAAEAALSRVTEGVAGVTDTTSATTGVTR
ncbi:MAG: HisA/HisF-related TIM barrel protein [Ornithinimicrobium sp.]